MFVFVLAWLAQHQKRWVVLAAGTALTVAGIGIFIAGFTTHQPLISRVGVLITIGAIFFAVSAIRTRHSRAGKEPGHEALGHSHQEDAAPAATETR
jgi:uncharacterized membrane protein HdeD (DUF308 family)